VLKHGKPSCFRYHIGFLSLLCHLSGCIRVSLLYLQTTYHSLPIQKRFPLIIPWASRDFIVKDAIKYPVPLLDTKSKMADVEKAPLEADQNSNPTEVSAKERAEAFVAPTPKEEKDIIRKLDFHIMPIVFILYMLAVLDRSNLGNARLAGMEDGTLLSTLSIVRKPTYDPRYRPFGLPIQLAWYHILHCLYLLAMAPHGVETVPTVSPLLRGRAPEIACTDGLFNADIFGAPQWSSSGDLLPPSRPLRSTGLVLWHAGFSWV